MATITESTAIAGVWHVEPAVHGDQRGLFIETYRREWIPGAREMLQSNRANRQAGAIVGLHYHLHQADYWYIPFGTRRRTSLGFRAQAEYILFVRDRDPAVPA